MKKFYSFLVAAVLLMGATSCQKEATADAGAADNVEFVASIAGGRTELSNGKKVMWNANDNIRIFTQENLAGTEFNSDATAATATAKFTTTQSFTASNNGYLAVYPETANTTGNGFSSTVHNASYAEGVWSIPVNLSSGYGNPSNFPMAFEKNAFMVAFSNDNQLSFKAATALLKIKNIENGWGGSVKLFGANLCGEATLHYDTNNAENPISYTLGSGDSHFEYYFPEQNGETIYVPIYPGTVTGFEVYGDDYLNPLVTYNNTITFKAGVIYDLDLENAPIGGGEDTRPVSPWQLFNLDMEASVEMRIDGDYHVATLKQSGPFVITDASKVNIFGFAGEVANNQWYKTGVYNEGVTHGPAYLMAYESYPLDIYITEDAGWFCVVPQIGGELPELPQVSTLWGMAGTHQANQWTAGNPSEMYVVGDYAVAYNIPGGSQFKFIDKVNGGSNGWDNAFGATNENAMMAQVRNVCGGSNVTLPTEATSYDIYLNKTNNYFVIVPVGATLGSAPTKLYMQPRSEWMESGARFVAYFCNNGEDWVDMTDSDSDGVYECDVPTKEYPVVLFLRMNPSGSNAWGNENVWNQTGDLCVPLDGTNFATITSAGDDWNAVNVTWSTK